MKILNISASDWSNFAYDNMLALRSVGLNCDSVVTSPHQFYETQSKHLHTSVIGKMISDYDVIQFFHDNVNLFGILASAMKGKKIIAYHTSSEYRKNSAYINSVMNPLIYKSVNAMPEFMALGSHNPIYMVGAVDTDKLVPSERQTDSEAVFAHYPSNPIVKGTDKIIETVSKLPVIFKHSVSLVPYADQLKRISECDVYIEMLTEKDANGMPYGNFGITALEAAALGKVVITGLKDKDSKDEKLISRYIYDSAYGFCGLNIANTANKLKRTIESLSNYSGDYLKGQQQITREWVVKNHSYKATGEYYLRNVLSEI